jgi:hypothetical protein
MKGHCDCGSVVVTIPELPNEINACPCSFCNRAGAQWGYFPAGTVDVKGETEAYCRASRTIEFHRCAICGILTHWQTNDRRIRHTGVNMRNFDPEVIATITVVANP